VEDGRQKTKNDYKETRKPGKNQIKKIENQEEEIQRMVRLNLFFFISVFLIWSWFFPGFLASL